MLRSPLGKNRRKPRFLARLRIWGSGARIPPVAPVPGSIPDTWVTVYTGDIGNTFPSNGRRSRSNSDALKQPKAAAKLSRIKMYANTCSPWRSRVPSVLLTRSDPGATARNRRRCCPRGRPGNAPADIRDHPCCSGRAREARPKPRRPSTPVVESLRSDPGDR